MTEAERLGQLLYVARQERDAALGEVKRLRELAELLQEALTDALKARRTGQVPDDSSEL